MASLHNLATWENGDKTWLLYMYFNVKCNVNLIYSGRALSYTISTSLLKGETSHLQLVKYLEEIAGSSF